MVKEGGGTLTRKEKLTSNLNIESSSKRRSVYSNLTSKQLSCNDKTQLLHSTPKLEINYKGNTNVSFLLIIHFNFNYNFNLNKTILMKANRY